MLQHKNTIALVLLLMASACKKQHNTLTVNITNHASVTAEDVKLYVRDDYFKIDGTVVYVDSLSLPGIEVGQTHSQTWDLNHLYNTDGGCKLYYRLDTTLISHYVATFEAGHLWFHNSDVMIYDDSLTYHPY